MPGDDPTPMRLSIHCWLDDACATFCLRDKEVAAALSLSVQHWRKIRHGKRSLQYAQRCAFKRILQKIADPAEYARWLKAEPPAMHRRLPKAS